MQTRNPRPNQEPSTVEQSSDELTRSSFSVPSRFVCLFVSMIVGTAASITCIRIQSPRDLHWVGYGDGDGCCEWLRPWMQPVNAVSSRAVGSISYSPLDSLQEIIDFNLRTECHQVKPAVV